MNLKKILLPPIIVIQATLLLGMNNKAIEEKKESIVDMSVANEQSINEYRKYLYKDLNKDPKKWPILQALYKDMAHYWIDDNLLPKKNRPSPHIWHLLEHSIIVASHCFNGVVCPPLDQNKNLCKNLCKNLDISFRHILFTAALLHDIGKAGQPNCLLAPQSARDIFKKNGDEIFFISKEGHEQIGFEYIMHDLTNSDQFKQYKTVDGKTINFSQLLDEFELDESQKRMVAVLVGAHKMFDDVFLRDLYAHHNKESAEKIKTPKQFVQEIFELADKAGLPKNLQNKILVKMVCILTLANHTGGSFDTKCGKRPARREFAKPGWLESKPEADEISIRIEYCKKIFYGDPEIKSKSKGAIAIIDEIMNLN